MYRHLIPSSSKTTAHCKRKIDLRLKFASLLTSLTVFGFFCGALANAAENPWITPEPDVLQKINVGGLERTFYVHLPNGRELRRPLPVLLVFHGGGGNALAMAARTHMDTVSDTNKFIVVYPQSVDNHWNDGRIVRARPNVDDVGFVRELLKKLEGEENIDQSRIYAAGFSDGGWFTQRLTFELKTLAGAAMVSSPETTTLINMFGPSHPPMPVLFMLGTSDPRMPWFGGAVTSSSVISADGTINAWVLANGCSPTPAVSHLPNLTTADHCHVELSFYSGPRGNDVAFYKIIGGGHSWPGGRPSPAAEGNTNQDIDGSQVIWNFLSQHRNQEQGCRF